jgi:hypothetical protein
MSGAWLEPIELQGNLPHRILVVSDNREDYYGTVRLCLDEGQNMEVIYKTYGQASGQGTFDVVILFSPATSFQKEALNGILARGQCRGCLLVVDGEGQPQEGDPRIRETGRAEFPVVIRSILSGGGDR